MNEKRSITQPGKSRKVDRRFIYNNRGNVFSLLTSGDFTPMNGLQCDDP